MREKLINLENKNIIITGEYLLPYFVNGRKTGRYVFRNIRDIEGNELADHMILRLDTSFEKLNLHPYDVISVEGIVHKYKRENGTIDYGIKVPYNIRVVLKNIKGG